MKRVFLIVLDGVGMGSAPDQIAYGDDGSDTLGNVAQAVGGLALPTLERLGLGRCRPLAGVEPVAQPEAAFGVAFPTSAGKDSTSGHWELCGLVLERPFPTYPRGFPEELLAEFASRTGRGVLGNLAVSGTAVLDRFGPEHQKTGKWIVYTSADSVFQVAAHEEIIPPAELYAACRVARELLVGQHAVSRVIARPFVGKADAYRRTAGRKDLALEPVGETLLDRLSGAGVPRVGIGKVDDLFAGRAIASTHAATNAEAYALIERALLAVDEGLVFANVIEFDQTWGHRNDVAGFHDGLLSLDMAVARWLPSLRDDDWLILTADHGNDPTTPSTDHSREAVPLLVAGPRVRPASLGERSTFADVGATVAERFGVGRLAAGTSFLAELAT